MDDTPLDEGPALAATERITLAVSRLMTLEFKTLIEAGYDGTKAGTTIACSVAFGLVGTVIALRDRKVPSPEQTAAEGPAILLLILEGAFPAGGEPEDEPTPEPAAEEDSGDRPPPPNYGKEPSHGEGGEG